MNFEEMVAAREAQVKLERELAAKQRSRRFEAMVSSRCEANRDEVNQVKAQMRVGKLDRDVTRLTGKLGKMLSW